MKCVFCIEEVDDETDEGRKYEGAGGRGGKCRGTLLEENDLTISGLRQSELTANEAGIVRASAL
jgi:hypothetical protein